MSILKRIKQDDRLSASFTIEASVIMPVILTALVGMILFSYKLHDIVTANITANEAAEIYSHLPYDDGTDEVTEYGSRRLGSLFSGRKYSVSVEQNKDGSRISVSGDEGTRVYEDNGYMPQKFMRRVTVIEEIADNGS